MAKSTNAPALVQRVEARLKEKDIPITTFYAETGITSGSMSQWRTGKFYPSKKNVKAMAEYLGTTEEWLTTGQWEAQTEQPAAAPSDLLDHTIKYALFGDDARLATDADLQAVYSFARFIISQKKESTDDAE